jgi:peptide/nickel transport system substrate-binding protein
MNKRLSVAAAAVLGLALLLGSVASSQGATGARSAVIPLLREGVVGSGGTLDPARNTTAFVLASFGLETLMNWAPDGRLEPWLAQTISHPGPDIFIYHLRHGVKFWDGNELTATDVANSLNYERYPGSQLAFSFTTVKNVAATDRYTVVVTLKHPDPAWQSKLAEDTTAVFEKKFADAHRSTFGQPGTLIMGSGPWQVVSFDPTSGGELTANPHWWGGKVPIQHLSIKFFADENSMALAFRAGAIDVAFPTSPRSFSSTAATTLQTWPACSQLYISMNTKVAPWNDIHVRRAVAYAIDRPALIGANGGYASPIFTQIPPTQLRMGGSNAQVKALLKSLPQYPFDLAKAKAELAKSAYPNGFSVTLPEIPILNLDTIGQAIANQLSQINIKAKVDILPIGAWLNAISGPTAQRPTLLDFGTCVGISIAAYDWMLGSKNAVVGQYNTAVYTPPDVDTLITDGETAAALSPAKAFPIFAKLLTRLQTDLPYISLLTPQSSIALASKFKLDFNPNDNPVWTYTGDWPLHIKPR